jgi:hypothetical protein
MELSQLYTVLITLVTVLGSAGAWRYYDNRAKRKERTDNFMKDDCRERIRKMEILLERSASEKEEMRKEILKLTAEVSELRVKVEFLEKENIDLIKKQKI